MKSLNLICLQLLLIIGLSISATLTQVEAASPLTQPDQPTLVGEAEPYVLYVCESEWNTYEFRIDGQPGIIYRWDKFTDADVLDKFEFSADNTRVRISDPAGLPTYVNIFLVVQAIDATSCESFPTTVTLVMVPQMEIPMVDEDTVCTGKPFLVSQFQNGRIESYDWDFGTEAEELTGDSEDEEPFGMRFNSDGEKSLTFTVRDTFGCTAQQTYDYVVYDAPPPPNIVQPCNYISTDSVLFEWTVDDNYTYEMNQLSIPGAATVFETDTTLLVTGIAPENLLIIEVSAEGNSPAPCNFTKQQVTCRACLPVDISTQQISKLDFCEGDVVNNFPVLLTAAVTSLGVTSSDPPEGSWSGTGVVMQGGNAFFDPAGLAPGEYTVSYDYIQPDPTDNCLHEADVFFRIFERAEPNASLSSDMEQNFTEICSDESVVVYFDTYDDRSRPDIFLDATVTGVTQEERSDNSQRLFFPNEDATYAVYVRYGLLGCEPLIDTLTVKVSLKPEVNIECGPQETDAVSITWEAITGTASYQVYLDGVPVEIVNGTSYTAENLVVDQTYELTVEPLALGCSDSGTITCNTGGCITPDIDTTRFRDPICYDPSTGPLNLDVDFTSNRPGFTGTYRWMSPEIDDDNNFTPNPFVENYTFDIEYSEGNCTEVFQAISFSVITEPVVELTLSTFDNPDVETICFPTTQLNLTATFEAPDQAASLEYIPIWPDGVNPTGQGPGSYLLQLVDGPGDYVFQMQAIYKGCPGPIITKTLTMEPATEIPMVTCTPGIGEIALEWDPIDCVTAYRVYLNNAGQDELLYEGSGQTYTISGVEGDVEQVYTVEAITNCQCGNSTFTDNCTPLPCPDDLSLEAVDVTACFGSAPFELPVNVTESTLLGPGSGSWSGLVIDGNGMVNSALSSHEGPFELVYTYTQESCEETLTVLFEFTEAPQVSVVPMDPSCPDDTLGTVIVSIEGGTPGYQYSLNGADFVAVADNTITEVVGVGSVDVSVMDDAGCLVSEFDNINPSAEPTADLSGPDLIVENNDAEFEVSTDLDLDLLTNVALFLDGELVGEGTVLDPYNLLDVSSAGELMAILTYGENCELTASKEFEVNALHSIYIPNMVDYSGRSTAPDNAWTAFVKGDEAFIEGVQVFDRWGNMVRDYENNAMDYFKELLIWDGYYGSVPAKQGVYTYVMRTVIEGIPQVKTGNVTILR